MLSSGIPGTREYQALDEDPDFQRLYDYSRRFQAQATAGDRSSRLYGAKWVSDPFLQWSRRWEYVYVLQRLRDWWQEMPPSPDIADAGSGFTFFPFYLKELRPGARILCIDADPTAGRAIEGAAQALGSGPQFALEDLENLHQAGESLDAVFSISVIEHTQNPHKIVEEIHRVLRPGGIFVCTFDVSFETGSPMRLTEVGRLLDFMHGLFEVEDGHGPGIGESVALPDRVTTAWVAKQFPERLPWRYPRLVWLYDALRGRFRSSLFRPMTFYCGTYFKNLP